MECYPTSTLHRKLGFHATHQMLALKQFLFTATQTGANVQLPVLPRRSATQQRCSKIWKEVLAVVFALKKFHKNCKDDAFSW